MTTSKFVAPVEQRIPIGLRSGDGLCLFRPARPAFPQCCGDFFHYGAGFFTSLRFAFARHFDFGDFRIHTLNGGFCVGTERFLTFDVDADLIEALIDRGERLGNPAFFSLQVRAERQETLQFRGGRGFRLAQVRKLSGNFRLQTGGFAGAPCGRLPPPRLS